MDGSDNICPKCNQTDIIFESNYGHRICNSCGYVWGKDEDDPDYEEVDFSDLATPECIDCGSTRVYWTEFGFLKCESCGLLWSE